MAGRQVQLQAPTTLYNVSTLQQQQAPQQYALHPSQSSLFAAQGNQFFTPPTHPHTHTAQGQGQGHPDEPPGGGMISRIEFESLRMVCVCCEIHLTSLFYLCMSHTNTQTRMHALKKRCESRHRPRRRRQPLGVGPAAHARCIYGQRGWAQELQVGWYWIWALQVFDFFVFFFR